MARSMNRVTLCGNVGAEPEVRAAGSSRVATISLATSRQWTNEAGQKHEKTEWHRLVVWNRGASKLADVVEQYVSKGDRLLIEGEISYRQWTDKEGQNRYATEIVVRELILLGGRGSDRGDAANPGAAPSRPAAAPAKAKDNYDEYPLPVDDDDLPF